MKRSLVSLIGLLTLTVACGSVAPRAKEKDVIASSLAALQTQASSGFFADASKLSFRCFGGDQLHFERL